MDGGGSHLGKIHGTREMDIKSLGFGVTIFQRE